MTRPLVSAIVVQWCMVDSATSVNVASGDSLTVSHAVVMDELMNALMISELVSSVGTIPLGITVISVHLASMVTQDLDQDLAVAPVCVLVV